MRLAPIIPPANLENMASYTKKFRKYQKKFKYEKMRLETVEKNQASAGHSLTGSGESNLEEAEVGLVEVPC